MFSIDRFVDDCVEAARADSSHRLVEKILSRALSDPAGVVAALGEPSCSQLLPLYRSSGLTILNVVWKAGMTINPHNHRVWSVIGIYQGREDNVFWRRVPGRPAGRIEAAGGQVMSVGDVTPLGKDIIHSVTNPTQGLTGAIHIYGGDFFQIERSEWDAETLTERRYDMTRIQAMFGA